MDKIDFKIITPEKSVFSEKVEQITMMTAEGEITVLPGHIPLVGILRPGELRFKKDGAEHPLAVSGGFVEVRPGNEVVILADTAERAEEINLERAEAAKERAEKLLLEARSKEDVDYTSLQAAMERALNRLRVAKKYRHLPPTQ